MPRNPLEKIGGRSRTRTYDPLIKSQLPRLVLPYKQEQIKTVAGPRNHHCNITAVVSESECLGEAAMDIAVSERQSERPNPTRPQGKFRPQGYRRR